MAYVYALCLDIIAYPQNYFLSQWVVTLIMVIGLFFIFLGWLNPSSFLGFSISLSLFSRIGIIEVPLIFLYLNLGRISFPTV